MLNFFRRIRQKLLSQGRLSKYLIYAIGEIALVMIGILLALQVNNWNENRKIKQKEKIFLHSLRADLIKNQALIHEARISNLYHQELGKTWITMMSQDVTEVKWTPVLDSLLFYGPDYHISDFILSTYNTPVPQSSLELISNDSLRRLIVDYPSHIDKFKDIENEIRRIVIERIRPRGEMHISLRYHFDRVTTFTSDYTSLLKDRQLNNDYINRNWQIDEMLEYLDNLELATSQLISILEKELQNRFDSKVKQ